MFKIYPNKSAMNSKRGRYLTGGDTDIFSNRLGWWERDLTILTRALDDVTYLITKDKEFKPSLVAYEVYNTTELEWLVLMYNNIVDINEEFVTGKYLTSYQAHSRALYQIAIK
jgi:hypothetical protein